MNNHLISVIVPAYNEEATIKNCLKSLLRQNFPKRSYEIIVVDNNSSDQTVKIVKKFNLKLVKEERQGLVFARMKGIEESRGETIAFIDADTIVKPQWLSKIQEIYQKYPKVVGLGFIADFQPKNFLTLIVQTSSEIGLRLFKILPGYCFSFKKSAYFKSEGYSSLVDIGEDIYFSRKIAKTGPLLIYETGLVTTSARRFQDFKNFVGYSLKTLVASFSILFLGRSSLRLGAVREKRV